jgi:DNA-binding NarL/FixJ family response regulator
MEPGMIRILLADDHPVVRFGLSTIIGTQADMTVVGQAATGLEAVRMFREHLPDVTLMDLRMPGPGGAEAIRVIRKDHPSSRFIVVTTYHGDEDIYKALAAGAQGYLLKGMSHFELLEAIRRVHAGLRYLPESVRQSLANRPPSSELSARELQILRARIYLTKETFPSKIESWQPNQPLFRKQFSSIPIPIIA